MSEKYTVEHFEFENQETYERALKEHNVISMMKKKYRLTNGKTALKLYEKAIEEKAFTTIVGYSFLEELRQIIRKTGAAGETKLADIPVLEKDDGMTEKAVGTQRNGNGTMMIGNSEKYRRLYEGQQLLNRRLKIIVVALLVLVVAIVVIDIKSEYSVFTYFTNYKAKMEEELIDKYENWESELKAREDALNEQSQ